MITKLLAGCLALALALALAFAPSGEALAKKNNTAVKIGVGVAAGVAAAIILNEAAKANAKSQDYDDCPGDSYRNKHGKCVKEYEPSKTKYESNWEIIKKCEKYSDKCDDGEKWACRKAADYCDRG